MNKYQRLFSPFSIKTMTLKNRIVMSPMGSNFALSSGEMSLEHIEYYRLRAAGGVGLIILENVCVDYPKGSNGTTQLRLDQDCFIPRLYRFNEEMHRYGACTSVQINHAGCMAIPERIGGMPVSASELPLAGGGVTEALSRDELERLAVQYGKAAARAKQAGFDSVEIHAGHGYLIDQFLSPIWNHRDDEFGGSPENRARFCQMVVAEVRKAVGEQYPVLIRMSVEDFSESGHNLKETIQMIQSFQDGVDLIDVSAGLKYAMDVAQRPDGWRAFLGGKVKEQIAKPCAVMGNIRDPQMAEDILARGDSDLIVIGRGLLADPQWALKAQRGEEEEIRPCISCNIGCVGHRMGLNRPIRCTVNPSIGTEEWHKLHKVQKHCRVVVVGGGVSGLEAACTAAESGCSVTLLEKEPELGGWLREIAEIPQKFRMKRLLSYMLKRVERLKNLTCLTGVTVTAELIKTFQPDLVVWSIGSEPTLPPIEGLHEQLADPGGKLRDVKGFLNNLSEEISIQNSRIAIAGGGAVALDIAEFFLEQGNAVSIVEQLPEVGQGSDKVSRQYMLDILKEGNAEVYTSHRLMRVEKNAFHILGAEGEKSVEFDYGFICLGLRARRDEGDVCRHLTEQDIPVVCIGDGKRARRIYEGIAEGRNIVQHLRLNGFYEKVN